MPASKFTKILECRGHYSPILNCSGIGVKSDFYASRSPFAYFPEGLQTRTSTPVGLIPYCKVCVQKIFEYYYDNGTAPFNTAVYYTCQKLDIPFIMEIFNEIFKEYKDRQVEKEEEFKDVKFSNLDKKYMAIYIGRLNKGSIKYAKRIDFSCSDTELAQVDLKFETQEKIKRDVEEYIMQWGVQESENDYKFLNETFEKYTKGIDFTNAPQEDLYRDLCIARLKKRKLDESGSKTDAKDIASVQSQITSLMKLLKADDFESNKPKNLSEESLFAKIKLIKENNVTDIYKEPKKFEDFNKYRQYMKDLCLRPMGNNLIGNRDFNISLEDMEKYDLD